MIQEAIKALDRENEKLLACRCPGCAVMIAARVAALFVLACFAVPGPVLHAGEPDRWLEARTPHFVVTSNAGEEHARRVSLELERVRTMLQRTLANVRFDPHQPVIVLAVSDEQSLRELLPQYWERKDSARGPLIGAGRTGTASVAAPDHEHCSRILHSSEFS